MRDESTPEIDPDHPWVEASAFMTPRPTEVMMRCEPYTIEFENGKELDVAHVSALTPVGVFDLFLSPPALIQLLEQGGATLQQLAEKAKKSPSIVVADATAKKLRGV
jgi:hypothetical protein